MKDAPQVPPNSISLYGLKRASDDIAALAKEVGAPKIILGGHDWYVVRVRCLRF
jgi:soluble epoxide hydrolase/lipid-phosphate phosphatase